MSAAKLPLLSPLNGRDGDTANKQHSGSAEARINDDSAPYRKRLQDEGGKSATGVKTTIS